jgi:hypothetical protein
MEKGKRILADCLTFGLIALAGAVFSFSSAGGMVALTGRVVCCVSSVLVALAVFIKRPPGSSL